MIMQATKDWAKVVLLILGIWSSVDVIRFAHCKLVQMPHQYFYQLHQSGQKFLVVLFSTDGCKACQLAWDEFKATDELLQETDINDVIFGVANILQDIVLPMHFNVKAVPVVIMFPFDQPLVLYKSRIERHSLLEAINETVIAANERRQFQSQPPSLSQRMKEVQDEDENSDSPKLRNFTQSVTKEEFEKKILNPKVNTFTMFYGNPCPVACDWFEALSRIFRNDGNIKFYKFNIEQAPQVVTHFKLTTNPGFVWFPVQDKLYGTVYRHEVTTLQSLVNFLNENSGNSRAEDASLLPNTGQIKELNKVIENHIMDILAKKRMKYVVEALDKASTRLPHPKRFKDYYVTIVREIEKGRDAATILQKEQNFIQKKLKNKNLSQRQFEDWNKYFHIVGAFADIATRHMDKVEKKLKHQPQNSDDEFDASQFTQTDNPGTDQIPYSQLRRQTAEYLRKKKTVHLREEL